MTELKIRDINRRCIADPVEFIEQSEQDYLDTIHNVALQVCETHKERPIVLLNGPSSSGKTTTARRLRDELKSLGVNSHAISMDDYYLTRGTYEIPVDEEGNIDLESPLCMDLPLLSNHLASLAAGKSILVPQYDFEKRSRTDYTEEVELKKDEVAVIEGIHSLNDVVTGGLEDCAVGVYMAVGTQIVIHNDYRIAPNELRFIRRAIRDNNFRNEPVSGTINQWKSVRRGERLYIHPYVKHATHIINTYLPYEDCILMNMLRENSLAYINDMYSAGLGNIVNAMGLFEGIADISAIPERSIMHEFIG